MKRVEKLLKKRVESVLGREVGDHWEELRRDWRAFSESPEHFEFVKDCVLKWLDDFEAADVVFEPWPDDDEWESIECENWEVER